LQFDAHGWQSVAPGKRNVRTIEDPLEVQVVSVIAAWVIVMDTFLQKETVGVYCDLGPCLGAGGNSAAAFDTWDHEQTRRPSLLDHQLKGKRPDVTMFTHIDFVSV
jgi:hypothetical protein